MKTIDPRHPRLRVPCAALFGAVMAVAAGVADAAAIAAAKETRSRPGIVTPYGVQPVTTSGTLNAVDVAAGTLVINGTRYGFDRRIVLWRESRSGGRLPAKLEELKTGTTVRFRNLASGTGLPRVIEIVLP